MQSPQRAISAKELQMNPTAINFTKLSPLDTGSQSAYSAQRHASALLAVHGMSIWLASAFAAEWRAAARRIAGGSTREIALAVIAARCGVSDLASLSDADTIQRAIAAPFAAHRAG
jgi:hypothetical protein